MKVAYCKKGALKDEIIIIHMTHGDQWLYIEIPAWIIVRTKKTYKNHWRPMTDREVWLYHRKAFCRAVFIGFMTTVLLMFLFFSVAYLYHLCCS